MPKPWPHPTDRPLGLIDYALGGFIIIVPILAVLSAITGCSDQSTPVETITLPRPSIAAKDGGWPATGIARLGNGDWVIGHDGRRFDGDKVHRTRLIILTPDMRAIRRELDLTVLIPGIESVQGVAIDQRGIWIGDLSGQAVRLIAGDQLARSISLGFKVNGVASDGQRLYVGAYDDMKVRVIEDGNIVRSFDLDRVPDQLHFAGGRLYATDGVNGQDGNITIWNPVTGKRVAAFESLKGAQSIEGVHIDGETATVISDGGFHREARPPKTLALRYTLPL